MKRFLFFTLTIPFVGCALAAKIRARDDMEASKVDYKNCLRANSETPQKCDSLKAMYEADLKAYRQTTNAMRNGIVVDNE